MEQDDSNALVYPDDWFDEDEVSDPDGFKTLVGHYGTGKNPETNKAVPDNVMYHPDHWDIVYEFPDYDPKNFWYRTNTAGAIALKAKTPAAKVFLKNTEDYNDIGLVHPRGRVGGGEA